MTIQKIITIPILISGVFYFCFILYRALKDKDAFRSEKGSLSGLLPGELLVYFLGSTGISDYLMNTLLIKKFKLTEDEKLPGTLVASCLVPCSVFAFSFISRGESVDMKGLILCAAAVALGSFLGSRLLSKIDGKKIKTFMIYALIFSFIALIIKMIISSGASGTATALTGARLIIAVVLCFITGLINMFGIPMKPTWTALFLILGLSPIAALTMVQSVGYFGPMSGGYNILKTGKYHQKTALSAAILGTLGALLGVTLALTISAGLLNIILLIVMALAIVSMIFS